MDLHRRNVTPVPLRTRLDVLPYPRAGRPLVVDRQVFRFPLGDLALGYPVRQSSFRRAVIRAEGLLR